MGQVRTQKLVITGIYGQLINKEMVSLIILHEPHQQVIHTLGSFVLVVVLEQVFGSDYLQKCKTVIDIVTNQFLHFKKISQK